MILEISILVLLIVLLVLKAYSYIKDEKAKNKSVSIPFKESLDLVQVPIVTFTNNGQKVHLMLDTGSDLSYLDSSIVDSLEVKSKKESSIKVAGAGGSVPSEGRILVDITYDNYTFEEEFTVLNLKDSLFNAFGNRITIHGILGSAFFSKYRYKLNFDKFIAQV